MIIYNSVSQLVGRDTGPVPNGTYTLAVFLWVRTFGT